ncbi:protein-L-isoaspartate O-methyltransferase [candidate division MSBL1 archaeon SCGC-AAA259I14]|uniref:Protein-L-isoaspartate O-methyltransferase n=1 Tax=candidate division MSBL1 archaeon SCGC-AAA259I14 TaxID=1698268 RepID=A0A133UPS5_9EURY|nr:protein-L-isoaspartate O-methyltransferase [candidate division MSBL1 archaeon SCGC-AAA259I14]
MYKQKREDMVQSLERRGYLESSEVIEAFRKVPREKFVPSSVRGDAYADRPLSIGEGQTISAPSMIAIMLEVLKAKDGDKILEIGTGSGYNAALMAEIIGPVGEVHSIERIKTVAETGRENLERNGYEQVKVIVRDGTKGFEEEAPWDKIIITACAPEVPDPLIEQLKVGGKLVAPVGEYYRSQTLLEVEKVNEEETKVRRHGSCAFVPLVGEYGWDEGKV